MAGISAARHPGKSGGCASRSGRRTGSARKSPAGAPGRRAKVLVLASAPFGSVGLVSVELNYVPIAADLMWPLAVALAWVLGELGHRWTGLPRISLYGIVGFILASAQAGLLPSHNNQAVMLLANVAFGLILFEFGYRINLRWVRMNRWIGATALLESLATFIGVYALGRWYEMPVVIALLLASLAMATSPAAVMRVVNEENSSGQVTERVLHLAAFNCVLAVFAFKVIAGLWIFQTSGSLWQALSSSFLQLVVSAGLGAVFGLAVPATLRALGNLNRDATVGFAIAIIVLVALTHALTASPVLAALTFGIVARHRRISLSQTQRNFGALGDLLAVLLFVFIGATLEWNRVMTGLGLGVALIAVRLTTKTAAVAMLARVSGISWRKGALAGIALAPISVFVILLLEHARALGIDLIDQLAPLAAATLLMEIIGPVLTQRSLMAAHETADTQDR
jgi:Kef-type K+ transport system membrane component KefB